MHKLKLSVQTEEIDLILSSSCKELSPFFMHECFFLILPKIRPEIDSDQLTPKNGSKTRRWISRDSAKSEVYQSFNLRFV